MTSRHHMLTTNEAAVVSAVSLRTVNRMFDDHILPDSLISSDNGRRILADACVYICFFDRTAELLTTQARKFAIHRAEHDRTWHVSIDHIMPEKAWVMWHDNLAIDLTSFANLTQCRYRLLDDARHAIVSDPDILGGEPVIRGTRVPAYAVAGAIASGAPMAEVLEDYPSLDAKKIELAVAYAEANPRHGRPKRMVERLKPLQAVERRLVERAARS